MKFIDYAKLNPTGEKHVLLTLDVHGESPIRLSGAGYVTDPSDLTLPDTMFKAAIAKEGIPRISRSLGSIWGGRGVSSWGEVTLIQNVVRGVDLRTANLIGKRIDLRLTGPADQVEYHESQTTLLGYVRSRSGTVGGPLVLHIADRGKQLERDIPVSRYSKEVEGQYFPESNDGKVKQIVLGQCSNVKCTLVDINDEGGRYEVSDPLYPIADIEQVYVNGVEVPFSKRIGQNSFVLNTPVNSSETVTARVRGVLNDGTAISNTAGIISWLLRKFTTFTTASQIDIDGIPSGIIGYVIETEISIDQVLSDLTKACLAQHYVTTQDTLKVRPLRLPAAGGPVITRQLQMSDVTWEEREEIFYRIPFTYDQNFAPLSVISDIVDQDFSIWLRGQARSGEAEDLGIPSLYPLSTVAPVIKTFFVDKVDAQAVANMALHMYGTRRYDINVTIPYQSSPLSLLDSISLTDTGVVDGEAIIHSIVDDYTTSTPTIKLRVWK